MLFFEHAITLCKAIFIISMLVGAIAIMHGVVLGALKVNKANF